MATQEPIKSCVTCLREFRTHVDDNHAICFACRVCNREHPCSTCVNWSPGRWDVHLRILSLPPPAPATKPPTLGGSTTELTQTAPPEPSPSQFPEAGSGHDRKRDTNARDARRHRHLRHSGINPDADVAVPHRGQ